MHISQWQDQSLLDWLMVTVDGVAVTDKLVSADEREGRAKVVSDLRGSVVISLRANAPEHIKALYLERRLAGLRGDYGNA